MFDLMRDRGLSTEDKRQELINGYLDNALTPTERAQFEARLAADARLRVEVEQLRALKLQMRAMPRRRVPRSFALDPAVYGRPKTQPLLQMYPVLRGATALTAFLLIFTLALGIFRGQFAGVGLPAPEAAEIAVTESMPEEAAAPSIAMDAPATDAAGLAQATSEEARDAEEAAAEMAAAAGPIATAEGTPAPSPEAAQLFGTPTPEEAPGQVGGAAAAGDATTLMATAPAEVTVEAVVADTGELQPAEGGQETTESESIASLLPVQIGLGIVLVVLLVAWLLARRRVRLF